MIRALTSVLFWSFLVVSSAALFPVALALWAVTAPFDRRKVVLHRFTCFWASLYTWLNPSWPVTVVGRDKLNDDDARILVANHLSLLDILVMFRLFRHFKWVSKVENFRVPCIGWNMRLNDYIPLRRGDRSSVQRMMQACRAALASGSSIMMFPEGTRSPTGRMRDFKTGAFELALQTGSPIQPIVIQGTHQALPKRGFVLRGRHRIRVTVLDPIVADDLGSPSARELTERIRALIAAHLGERTGDGEARPPREVPPAPTPVPPRTAPAPRL